MTDIQVARVRPHGGRTHDGNTSVRSNRAANDRVAARSPATQIQDVCAARHDPGCGCIRNRADGKVGAAAGLFDGRTERGGQRAEIKIEDGVRERAAIVGYEHEIGRDRATVEIQLSATHVQNALPGIGGKEIPAFDY